MNLYETGPRPIIDAYLKKRSEEVRDYGDFWSASSGGYCMRLNIMRRLGVPKVPELQDNATQTRIFEAGHIFHKFMQDLTKDAGISIAQEVELEDHELMIRGHFDDLLLIDGNLLLVDYKTAHSASFNYKKARTEIGHYHKMQLGTYMMMVKKQPTNIIRFDDYPKDLLKNLNESRILSISKDDLRMHEEQLLWSPQLEKEVVGYWRTLNGYWKAKTLPRCTCLDHDGGFMGRKSAKGKFYNDFFYEDEPCSMKWYLKWKDSKAEEEQNANK
jgi:CRISPR/Cas system-associated exonuclease Cas4 (RecB family)